jgi:hypothetical protein
MNKWEAFDAKFNDIKSRPLQSLSEHSLEYFQAFWLGYSLRERDESRSFQQLIPAGFHEFVNARFCNDTSHGAMYVVKLYSKNELDAWDQYFDLLYRYKGQQKISNVDSRQVNSEQDLIAFETLLPAVLQRPAMYVGTYSFKLIAELIRGWLQATVDHGYRISEYEQTFKSLVSYIEEFDINLPGPEWHKIIWFHAANDSRAFDLLSSYVDEYINQNKLSIERIENRKYGRLRARKKYTR